MLMRFDNSVDVRRAYEALVLRAPGEDFVPEAMLVIAQLRLECGELAKAIEVCGNLRNIHPSSPFAEKAFVLEAKIRTRVLEEKEYNRSRGLDTLLFLRQADTMGLSGENAALVKSYEEIVCRILDDEDWKAASFYDSITRTRRSARVALEKFIAEHPTSRHLSEAKARLEKMMQEDK